MKIKEEILTRIKPDKGLREKLAKEMGKTEHTIYLWMWGNSEMLTMAKSLKIIAEHTGIDVNNLLS